MDKVVVLLSEENELPYLDDEILTSTGMVPLDDDTKDEDYHRTKLGHDLLVPHNEVAVEGTNSPEEVAHSKIQNAKVDEVGSTLFLLDLKVDRWGNMAVAQHPNMLSLRYHIQVVEGGVHHKSMVPPLRRSV